MREMKNWPCMHRGNFWRMALAAVVLGCVLVMTTPVSAANPFEDQPVPKATTTGDQALAITAGEQNTADEITSADAAVTELKTAVQGFWGRVLSFFEKVLGFFKQLFQVITPASAAEPKNTTPGVTVSDAPAPETVLPAPTPTGQNTGSEAQSPAAAGTSSNSSESGNNSAGSEQPSVVTPAAGAVAFPAGASAPAKKADAAQIEKVWQNAGMTGTIAAGNYAANGGRPAMVYLPRGLDASKPVKVVTLFHGHNWNIGSMFNDLGVLSRIKELEAKNPNTVFVIPQAAQKPFSYWMKKPGEDYEAFMKQSLGEAARLAGVKELQVSERIVSAHSGGGLAVRNAITSGNFAADKIELLDANYGDWGKVMVDWAKKAPEGKKPHITAWDTPGDTRTHDAEILKQGGELVTVNRSAVAHNNVPGAYFGQTIDP